MVRNALMMVLAGVAIAAADPAFACKGGKVLLEDDFSTADPGWDIEEPYSVIANGTLTITPKQDNGFSVLYISDSYPKADICVEATIPPHKNPRDEYLAGGIVFMAVDYRNYHYFWHSPEGYLGVSRLANGKWTNPVPPRRFAFNKQAGAKNMLRVTYGDGRGTIYINDRKIVDFKALESEGAEYFGFSADSEEKGRNAWKFSNVKVTSVP